MKDIKDSYEKPSIMDYVAIARPDHWIKNVFMVPGAILALIVDPDAHALDLGLFVVGVISACCAASANYTINEYLDGKYDRFHPTKHTRPAARGLISRNIVLFQYLFLGFLALAIAAALNPMFMAAIVFFLFMGLVYNVEPVRTKDRVFLDVLSESVNNPIRLVLGWSALSTILLPPASLIISYWMAGAYLMAAKRYAEYRIIGDKDIAGKYRKSFVKYTEEKIILSSFFYAMTSCLFLGIFLIKYRVEFILAFPFIAFLFVWYQKITNSANSNVANPEKMYLEPKLLAYVVFLAALVTVLFFLDIRFLQELVNHSVSLDYRWTW